MKLHTGIMAALLLLVVSCTALTAPDTAQDTDPEYTRINKEVDKVELSVPEKAALTAGAVTQKDIQSAGFNTALYSIKYETITADSAQKQLTVTFFLKKDGIESKRRSITLGGFKDAGSAPSAQELINQEVDKVTLSVQDAQSMVAEDLVSHTAKIQAAGFNTAYTITYETIKPDNGKKEAAVTFLLKKTSGSDTIRSKTRTLTVGGFKAYTIPEHTADITEQDLLRLFDLTENKVTASAAAKKIAEGGTFGTVTFTGNQALAYNDTTGTFTVKVSGTKDGKPFEKKLTLSGFKNPYAAAPQSVHSYTLNFDEAIKGNKALADHITAINAAPATAFKESLSFSLDNGLQITLGEHEAYRLTAQFENKNEKIVITPHLQTKNYKKDLETAEQPADIVENLYGFHRLADLLTKPYFTEKDVLEHILNTVKNDESFIIADAQKFASEFYARVKVTKQTPQDLFNDTQKLKAYTDVYENKGSGHLEIKGLNAYLYNNDITANDYEGSLTLTYCIASADTASENLLADKISSLHTVTKTGFRRIDSAIAKDIFGFGLVKNGEFLTTPENRKAAWLQKSTMNTDRWLLHESGNAGDQNWFELKHDFLQKTEKNKKKLPHFLTLNGVEDIEAQLAPIGIWLSTGRSGEKILIKAIALNKKSQKEELTIKMYFCGNDEPLEWSIKPNEY